LSARNIQYSEDDGFVLVKTTGTYVLASEIDTLKKAYLLATTKQCKRLLFDHREAFVSAPTMQSYDRPNVYGEIGFDRSFKLATLVNEICADLKFYETVCQNRGWQMRVFDDFVNAVDWLNSVIYNGE